VHPDGPRWTHPPVSSFTGANCSLVLGALLLMARSLWLPRLPAAAVALAGLVLFVVLVGPNASVLRSALMGSIALTSLAGGRSGRGLSFLCLAVIGLLLFDPGLGTSFGFLLSVLATLGIIVLGRRIVDLTPAVVPRWVAAAFAVPLSARCCAVPSRCCCSLNSRRTRWRQTSSPPRAWHR
jgi:competence protein ComEC